jgi:two-component system sensor histidine kinase MtrB
VADVVRLRHLVDELMEISRLDGGQETVRREEVDPAAVIDAIVAARGWQDRVRRTGRATIVVSDRRRMERVLANLIANAVEHGGGPVDVRLTADSGRAIRVTVVDNGPGIPPEHLPRLFDRFYKADPARSGAGSGLGLAIAAENARLIGAGIEVRSTVGAGSEFHLVLPVTRPLPDGEGAVWSDPDGRPGTAREGGPP